MHDFHTDLEYSLDKSDDNDIDAVYRKAFPNLTNIEVVTDLEQQKKGIDKLLIFDSGKVILIDEKRRRRDYGDILLEEYSDFDRKKKGWLSREKYTDYIAYIILPKVYLFPFLLLQQVWLKKYKEWIVTYPRLFAENRNYRTSNIPIPTNVLLEELKKAILLTS